MYTVIVGHALISTNKNSFEADSEAPTHMMVYFLLINCGMERFDEGHTSLIGLAVFRKTGLQRCWQEKTEVPAENRNPPLDKCLEFHNILSLVSLWPFGNVEFNLVAFIQGFETTGLNSGMVHENIIPRIAPDKTVAFFIIKPLHNTLFFAHFPSS